jgi:hypothetical protein
MTSIKNCAVFLNGQKKMTTVNVLIDGNEVKVMNGTTGVEIDTHSVVETAKVDMAWDILDDGVLKRLVVQQGCGCGGMKLYTPDAGYSGDLGTIGQTQ